MIIPARVHVRLAVREDNVFEHIIIGLFQDYIEDAISVAKKKQGE